MVEVLHCRANARDAEAFVADLRAAGFSARGGSVRHFDPAQVDRTVEMVFHDGSNPLVPWTYGKLGIPCDLIPGVGGEGTHAPDSTSEHQLVITNEGLFQLTGPQGPIGDPKTNEADAWAELGKPFSGEPANVPVEAVNVAAGVFDGRTGEPYGAESGDGAEIPLLDPDEVLGGTEPEPAADAPPADGAAE